MSAAGRIKKILSKDFWAHRAYFAMYENRDVDSKKILCESMHGTALGGNIAAVITELLCAEEYRGYHVFLAAAASKKSAFEKQLSVLLKNHGSNPETAGAGISIVIYESREYFEALATAGFLVNDTSFPHCFLKREGQVYLNTWHGTPLKYLGAGVGNERFSMGNVQKNLFAADIILVPNKHTESVLRREYYLDNFACAHLARTGYPRNEVFFDEGVRRSVREYFGFKDSAVYAYMPTWRGGYGEVEAAEQKKELAGYLETLDTELERKGNAAVIFVKLHPMLADTLETEQYKHIKRFPDDYPTYDFLQGTDGLITDYSSIMFDYAVTGRQIILFNYDEEKYASEHGMYFDTGSLPFARAANAFELAEAICRNDTASDAAGRYGGFVGKFCPADGTGVTRKLISEMLDGSYKNYPAVPYNGKKNVLIYGGDFIRNGITVSLLNLLRNIDREKYNYLLFFEMKEGGKFEKALTEIPKDMPVIGASPVRVQTVSELLRTKIWEKTGIGSYRRISRYYRSVGRKEAVKSLAGIRISSAVHFTGYSPLYMLALESLDCRKTIFVHNDMNGEAGKKYAMPAKLVCDMYSSYSNTAVITEELHECCNKFMSANGFGALETVTVPNVFDYRYVIKRAEEELCFDDDTVSTHDVGTINKVLKKGVQCFINIGRFSPEKGQLRLIEAFESAAERRKSENRGCDSMPYLFIVGSYGTQYEEILKRVADSVLRDNIVVIKSIANPYPLLKACSLFVLSSFYEGLPVTVMEADALKIPCISTAVGAGPATFMRTHGGKLAEDSTEGICRGIYAFMNGESVPTLDIDYEKMFETALHSFECIL